MRYENVAVFGFYRAGTHYLAALLARTFFNTQKYLPFYAGHGKKPNRDRNTLNIYVYRNFDDTAKSMFRLRERMGIDTDDYNHFISSKLCDIWSPKCRPRAKVNYLYNEIVRTDVCSDFKGVNKTFKELWEDHVAYPMLTREHPNIHILRYEDLTDNFEDTIICIAKALGSDKREFVNIKERVGWYNASKQGDKLIGNLFSRAKLYL